MFGTFRDKMKETGTSYKGGSEEKVDAKGLTNHKIFLCNIIIICLRLLQSTTPRQVLLVCLILVLQSILDSTSSLGLVWNCNMCGGVTDYSGFYSALSWPASPWPPWTWPRWPRWWWLWPWAPGRSSWPSPWPTSPTRSGADPYSILSTRWAQWDILTGGNLTFL